MSEETTTDRLAEIEGQAEPQPVQVREGRWRTRGGDIRHVTRTSAKDERAVRYFWHDADHDQTWLANGRYHTDHTESPLDLWAYLGPIEPEPDPEPEPQAEPEPQPVQIREGRWRTRGGEIRNVTPTPKDYPYRNADRHSWYDTRFYQTWYPSGRYTLHGDHPLDLVEYLGPIESEPEPTITPDDVAAEALQQQLETTEAALLEQQEQNERLVTHSSQQCMDIAELQAQVAFLGTLETRLQEEKSVTAKLLEQIQELRSEVSHVQGLLGKSSRRIVELETLVGDLRAVNAAQEKGINAAARDKADLQHRLDTVAAEWAVQAETIRGLQTQLEAVKAELVRQCETSRRLQIELDAREQVPQAISDRFEEGWDKGTAQAVETIAEWLEPLRKGNCTLRAAILFHLPAIMRSLTGLTEED